MKRLAIVSLAVFLGALAGSACGGLPNSDILFGNGTTGAGGATTSSGSVGPGQGVTTTGTPSAVSSSIGSVGSGGGPGTGGATTVTTTTSASSTGISSSTGTASTSSTSSSGVTTTTTTTTTTASSSSGAPTPPVSCNGGTCNPGEVCCFNPSGPGDHCGNHGNCPMGFSELDCSDPSDCPGSVCCIQFQVFQGMVYYTGSSCQQSCDQIGSEFVICSAQDPNVCPSGTQCVQSQLLGTGYMICAN